jgi:predicted O-methyltransferase YrrM
LLTLIRPGGLIAVDNTLGLSRQPVIRLKSAHADAIRKFNLHVHRDPRVDIAMLPVGEGLTLLRVVS